MNIYLQQAIEQAQKSLDEGGIPTGAVLVKDELVIGSGRNTRVQENNPLGHAIVNAIINAGRIGSYKDTVVYATTMPCLMCVGTLIQFGIPKIVVADAENFDGSAAMLTEHSVEVVVENLEECKRMLAAYIKQNPDIWYEDIGQL